MALLLASAACGPGARTLGSPTPGGSDPEASRLLEAVGFPDRRTWSSTVLHLDGEEIGGPPRLSSVLRGSDRVRLRRPEGTEWGITLVDDRGENPCGVAVYINGSRYGRAQRPGSGVGLDDLIAPAAIAGMELHEGPHGPVIPGLDCAALLIWSLQAEPVYGFLGDIIATVEGGSADRVTAVVLEPGSREGRREGRITWFSVLPGEYQVRFLGIDGRVLDVRTVRAFAFAETEVSLEVHERVPDPE